jgi:hypothetical protein
MGLQAKSFGGTMDVPTVGTKMARLVGLIDLGHQPGFEYQGEDVKSSYKITFTYELTGSLMEDGRPHHVSEDVNVSDYRGDGITSKMMKRVDALDPTSTISNDGKNLAALIGLPCMVEVKHNKKGYPKITNVTGAPEGIPVPELQNDPKIFNFDEPDMDLYNKLPEFVQGKIKAALDFPGSEVEKALLLTNDVPF